MTKNLIKEERAKYFCFISFFIPPTNANLIVLTHILPDRLELIEAISKVGNILKIIAIPYSIDADMLATLQKIHCVETPNMSQLSNNEFLFSLFLDVESKKDLIIMEIGGYFSPILDKLKLHFGSHLLGIIESTEAGHRRYEQLELLPCPIVSIARGSLKLTEYSLIGKSCVFSADKIAREVGILLDGKEVLVLGYGRVGMGIAHSLRGRDCIVYVFDNNPIRRALAVSHGFKTSDKRSLFAKAHFIFGATGNYSIQNEDYFYLKKGAILISCSSKNIEFDLEFLSHHFFCSTLSTYLDRYTANDHHFYLAAEGFPANFIDNAIVGPILALIQAEILIATKTIKNLYGQTGLFEVREEERKILAEEWLNCFSE